MRVEGLKISVLMAAYNADKYIADAIHSITSQTYQNWELLICDDASTDQTYQVISTFKDSRIKVFRNDKNLKKPRSINRIFSKSTGDIVTIHDADDLSLPERFEKVIQLFERNPEIGMCGHVIERISEGGERLGLYRIKVADFDEIKRLMNEDNTDGDPSMFIKREVLQNLGEVFRPYFNNNMDYDLGLRIIEKCPSTNVLEVLSLYRNVPNSISKGVPDYRKLVTQNITKELAKERREAGKDALQRGDMHQIEQWEKHYSKPYLEDNTLHLRQMASFFMYCKMNREAIRYMWIAVKSNPFKLENWRTLQYCIRKTLLKI